MRSLEYAMATELERRVATLEAEVERLKARLDEPPAVAPWWERISGAFADDPAFEEAMRLGRKYREAQRPKPTGTKKGGDAHPRHGSRKPSRMGEG